MNWINEVRHDISTIQSTPKDLKKFGLMIGGIVLLLCGLSFFFNWWSFTVLILFSLFGIFLVISGIFFSQVLLGIHRWWMTFAVILGSIVSRIILLIVFFSVVTFISIAAKIFQKKFYIAHNDHLRSTYWIQRDRSKPINYERMS
ncbi:MAG: hypothetical protein Q8L88_04565 [Bacteroidota bacterium]|nr:hypothetical protein [Bacteroidota bacterium]